MFSQWLQEIKAMVFHSMGKETEAQDGPINFPTIQSGVLESECDPGNLRVCLLTHSFKQDSTLSHTRRAGNSRSARRHLQNNWLIIFQRVKVMKVKERLGDCSRLKRLEA